MIRFAIGLIDSLFLLLEFPVKPRIRVHGLIVPRSSENRATMKSVAKCGGCVDIITADSKENVPTRCPECGRPTWEIARELFFVSHKREYN